MAMIRVLALLMVCATLATAAAIETEGGVLVLTDDNIDQALAANPLIIVEFYAPWCGHCKKLTPEWSKAAKELAALPGAIPLAMVDATVHKKAAERFGVRGYPTIKVFRNSAPRDYKGPRVAAEIVTYVQSLAGPAAPPVESLEALAAYVAVGTGLSVAASGAAVVLGLFGGDADAASGRRMTFENLAEEWRGKVRFLTAAAGSVVGSPLLGSKDASFVGVAVFRGFNGSPAVMAWPEAQARSTQVVREFIGRNALPPVGELLPENQELYNSRGQPSVTMLLPGNINAQGRKYVVKRLETVAARVPTYSFAYANVAKHKPLQERFGFTTAEVDSNVAIGVEAAGKKYKFGSATFNAELLESFVQKVIAGTEPAFVKSEEAPAYNAGAGEGKVTIVTATNFKDLVLDDTKDVLLELYAPWCGHCKKLTPVYDELATAYVGVADLLIAKADATANDIPAPYSAGGYPTIFWAPKGQKGAPVKFSGDRTVEGFKTFIAKQRPAASAKADEL